MDGPGAGSAGEDDGDDLVTALIGLAHAILGGLIVRFCLHRCCGRRGLDPSSEDAGQGTPTATVDQLQHKKRVSTSYLLWLLAGAFGVHHFYLGRMVHGLVALWSFNLLGVGWVIDGFMIPFYVGGFNSRRTALMAPYDTSRRSLLCRLPLMVLALIVCVIGFGLYLPKVLHATGVVDIDRLAAQTEVNPYDTLGLSRVPTAAEARAAYHRESLRWHPDRNAGCGKQCERKMSEITKAYELIKKRQAPVPPDRTWEAWLKDIGSDWVHVLEVLSKDTEPTSSSTDREAWARTDL